MLSNIVLGVLVQELERRGLLYTRWADDFVILVGSRRAAERVMVSVIRYLEEEPGLPVNRDKSIIARIEEVTFLGFPVVWRDNQGEKRATIRMRIDVATEPRVTEAGWLCKWLRMGSRRAGGGRENGESATV